ncbi:G-protein-signaling modulator 2 [Echinococcus granulosus]|uniref:G-protein-signaling modulator 2 n=1 Tax=Echinococcus granulosus TaxID=6210 RepID=W6U4S3_ECHGR|nr:G-protein-signaling modulator 2 [Echinococcus granulosus]EUB56110.1 G-protein-signaling modulator 2 [Echinococcus granulosus]
MGGAWCTATMTPSTLLDVRLQLSKIHSPKNPQRLDIRIGSSVRGAVRKKGEPRGSLNYAATAPVFYSLVTSPQICCVVKCVWTHVLLVLKIKITSLTACPTVRNLPSQRATTTTTTRNSPVQHTVCVGIRQPKPRQASPLLQLQGTTIVRGFMTTLDFPVLYVKVNFFCLIPFRENLSLVCKLGDRPAEGRAYGNLGNTHYLLGNFRESVDFHKKRLQIAKEFGDLRAQRRAYSNLGNAYIFLADFTSAARSYKHALGIARQLGDEALQAQACFSLGHSCTLLRDYSAAVVYYLRHLHVAWEAGDRVGQGRCHWSLANVYAALGDYRRALRSSMRHQKISKELNDEIGLLAADLMIAELHQILGHSQPDPRLEETPPSSPSAVTTTSPHLQAAAEARALEQVLFDADSCVSPSTAVTIATTNPYVESPSPTVVEVAKEEVEELSEKELVTELSLATNAALAVQRRHGSGSGSSAGRGGGEGEFLSLSEEEEEDFVVVVSPTETESSGEHHRSGGDSVGEALHQATNQSNHGADQSDSSELLFDLLFKSQALRMNDQRCDLNALAGSNVINNNNSSSGGGNIGSDGNSMLAASSDSLNAENDSFLDLLINIQGARMNDQRADFPGLIRTNSVSNPPHTGPASNAATTTTITAPQRNTSSAAVVETTPLTTNGGGSDGGSVTLAARMRSASDGLAEAEQAPSAADELAPGDDFFDMIFRLQQKTRINDQRSVLPPTLQTHNHHHTNYRDRHQDSNSGNNNNNNEGATATGCHDGGGATAPHRLLRVLSVPGGKRRRRGGGGTGSGSSSSKAAVIRHLDYRVRGDNDPGRGDLQSTITSVSVWIF